jgi:hypothetical protein
LFPRQIRRGATTDRAVEISASSRFAVRERLRNACAPVRSIAVAEAMNTVEYVPATLPTIIVNAT